MMRDGWARQPPAAAAGAGAAAAPRAVGAKRERSRAALTNVMKVAREAERASQLAAKGEQGPSSPALSAATDESLSLGQTDSDSGGGDKW